MERNAMSVKTTQTETSHDAEPKWLSAERAVQHIQRKGIETFTRETLKHYAYRTDLLPKPKVVGKHAYWRVADLDRFVDQL